MALPLDFWQLAQRAQTLSTPKMLVQWAGKALADGQDEVENGLEDLHPCIVQHILPHLSSPQLLDYLQQAVPGGLTALLVKYNQEEEEVEQEDMFPAVKKRKTDGVLYQYFLPDAAC